MSRDWSQLSPRRRCYCFSPAQITWSQRQPRPPNLLIHFPPTYLPCTDSITSFWRQTHLPPTQTLFGNNNKPALLIYVKYWYIPWVHPVQVYHSVGFGIQDTQPFVSSNRLIGPSLPPKLTQFLFLCTPLTLILLLLFFFWVWLLYNVVSISATQQCESAMKGKSLSHVLTLCDPMDCSPPGSSPHSWTCLLTPSHPHWVELPVLYSSFPLAIR